jgi:hypothetical protein
MGQYCVRLNLPFLTDCFQSAEYFPSPATALLAKVAPTHSRPQRVVYSGHTWREALPIPTSQKHLEAIDGPLPYKQWQVPASTRTLLHPVYSLSSCLAATTMPAISATNPMQAKTKVEEVVDGFRRGSEILNSRGDFRGLKKVRQLDCLPQALLTGTCERDEAFVVD